MKPLFLYSRKMKALFFYFILFSSYLAEAQLFNLENWENRGHLGFESRQFSTDDDETTEDANFGLTGSINSQFSHENLRLKGSFFARNDFREDTRNIFITEEAFFAYDSKNWTFKAGAQLFNWSKANFFQIADFINSVNYDSNVGEFEKIGEPALTLELFFDEATLVFTYLPYYMKPFYPGNTSRLTFTNGVTGQLFGIDDPVWIEGDNEIAENSFGHQGGVYFNHSVSLFDYSLYSVHMMDRLQPFYTIGSTLNITPYFFRVTQTGGNLDMKVLGSILKFEVAYRYFNDDYIQPLLNGPIIQPTDHGIFVAGIERTFELPWGHTMNSVMEYKRILASNDEDIEAISVTENDIGIAVLYNFEDLNAQQIKFAMITDVEKDETFVDLSYNRRLGSTWKLDTGVKLFFVSQENNPPTGLEIFYKDNHMFFNVKRFF